MQTLFSVIIPTYNRGIKLRRAIESVLAQTYTNFEILVMDDGSTDNTSEVLASYKDNRITYEWDINFGGPSRPRNRGIALAKGEWVCFIDSDDWWTDDKLQVCFDFIHDGVNFIYHDLEIVSEKSGIFCRKLINTWQVKSPVLIDLLVNGNAIPTSSVVVRTKLLKQVGGMCERIDMIAAEDYNAWLRIANLTDQFIYLPRRLGYYLTHSQSISKIDMSLPWRCAVHEFKGLLNKQQELIVEARWSYISGRFKYLTGNYSNAKKDLLFALRNGSIPTRLRALLSLFKIALR